MSAVFGVPMESIDGLTSHQTLEQWDSLSHMKLVTALEEEFGVVFSDSEILELLSYPLVLLILSEKTGTPRR
ncbi:MAG: acyl carrier protein [Candidatus Omnitrophica bacterium]|nr:acyl carrier protein [Candidatus Omnitrophota bacterium]